MFIIQPIFCLIIFPILWRVDGVRSDNAQSKSSPCKDALTCDYNSVGDLRNVSQLVTLTLKSGAPIGDKLNSLLIGLKGPALLSDIVYVEETAHFNRERIPERVVHAKGAGAFGEFVVTSNEIAKYSKADFLSERGKRTPVVVRFSHVAGESGIVDSARDVRGFAVRFQTDQGNWDLVGNNLPVFFIRDPINFVSLIHSQKRNPKTHMKDPDAFWDFLSLLPESLHLVTMLFTERGIPDGFRHMHGFGVNTFKMVNNKGQAYYVKFHWVCKQQIRNLNHTEANRMAGENPDYYLRDLFDSIENGEYPSWTLKFQVMSIAEADSADFNVLDTTKTWPTKRYPLNEIGKLTLNRNADDYFAQIEQLAFSPSNMVPGIESSPDRMLVGRLLSYPDAQRYRLGANYADIPVNRPKCPVMTPTYRDSVTFSQDPPGPLPNYVPSSQYKNFHFFDKEYLEHQQSFTGKIGRYDMSEDDNYSQVRVLITKVLSKTSRQTLARNLANHLSSVQNSSIVNKVIGHYGKIDTDLSRQIESILRDIKKASLK